ncbi:MAG: hypothetical protein ACE5JP_13610 [Candidatus Bipolaricaulia bacterium]
MTVLGQFMLYNLLPSLVAGALAWLMVYAAIVSLKIQRASLRLPLLYVPLVKSTLILLGIGFVLPWPHGVFAAWNEHAVPPLVVLPYVLLWIGRADVSDCSANLQLCAGVKSRGGHKQGNYDDNLPQFDSLLSIHLQ